MTVKPYIELAQLIELCSCWAKTKKDEGDSETSQLIYEKKEASLRLLYNMGYIDISIYIPESPHKYNFELCDYHCKELRSEVKDETSDSYLNFLFYKKRELCTCEDCSVNKIEHYFSLFCLDVKNSDLSFHCPYVKGKSFYPKISRLKKANHIKNENGNYSFGRALSESEKIENPLNEVLKNTEKAIKKVKGYSSLDAGACF